jgi:hypothetical protein
MVEYQQTAGEARVQGHQNRVYSSGWWLPCQLLRDGNGKTNNNSDGLKDPIGTIPGHLGSPGTHKKQMNAVRNTCHDFVVTTE